MAELEVEIQERIQVLDLRLKKIQAYEPQKDQYVVVFKPVNCRDGVIYGLLREPSNNISTGIKDVDRLPSLKSIKIMSYLDAQIQSQKYPSFVVDGVIRKPFVMALWGYVPFLVKSCQDGISRLRELLDVLENEVCSEE